MHEESRTFTIVKDKGCRVVVKIVLISELTVMPDIVLGLC